MPPRTQAVTLAPPEGLRAMPERRSSGSRRPFVHASASAVMLVLVACASEPAEPGSAATVTTVASGASTTAGETTTTVGSDRCPSGMGAAAQTPAQAAVCLHQAWEEGNRRKAAVFASLDVVDRLFVEGRAPTGARFGGCRSDGHSEGEVCSYEHTDVEYRFRVRRSEGGWRVTEAQEAAT